MDDSFVGDDEAIFDDLSKPEEINVSSLMHIGSFVKQWESVLDTVDYLPNAVNPVRTDMLSELLGTSDEIVRELEGVCDPSSLQAQTSTQKPVDKMELHEAMPAGRGQKLSTLQFRLDCLKNPNIKTMHSVACTRGRFRSTRNTWNFEYDHIAKGKEQKQIVEPITILEMWFFKPHLLSGKDRDSKVKMMFDRELLVLSTQKLTEIKEKITCVTDETFLAEERSECPDLPQDRRAKDVFKSSFFFIEDTFYYDTSHKSCKDLSEPIRKWASVGRPGVASDMKSVPMEDVVLKNLHIRLGYPYLYTHQGDCEHVFLFSDIRLMHDADSMDLQAYPRLVNICSARRVPCIVCNKYTAKWVTREDSFSPSDPSFFCDKCFRMLHYDENGVKLGSFKAWPYVDVNTFS